MLDRSIATGSDPALRQHTVLPTLLIDEGSGGVSRTADVFLAGGHDLAFEGLKALLSGHGFNIVAVGDRLREVPVPAAYRDRRFLVIVEVDGAGDPTLDDILLFRRVCPHACIVALLDDFQKRVGLLPDDTAANAVVDRNVDCEALIKILSVALSGYGVLSPIAGTGFVAASGPSTEPITLLDALATEDTVPASLSGRELDIIGCIALGQSNKVIARRYLISEATVKIHVRGILRKVNARNRTQAAVWALHHGFGSTPAHIDR